MDNDKSNADKYSDPTIGSRVVYHNCGELDHIKPSCPKKLQEKQQAKLDRVVASASEAKCTDQQTSQFKYRLVHKYNATRTTNECSTLKNIKQMNNLLAVSTPPQLPQSTPTQV